MRASTPLIIAFVVLAGGACSSSSSLGSGTDSLSDGGDAAITAGTAGVSGDQGSYTAGSGGEGRAPTAPTAPPAPTATAPTMPTSAPTTLPPTTPTPTSMPPPASALPPAVAPSGCSGVDDTSDSSCNYALYCDSRTAYSDCKLQPDGHYLCHCVAASGGQQYVLGVDTSVNPCVPAALSCLNGVLEHESPRLCETVRGDSGACALERLCTQAVRAGDEAVVEELTSSSVQCSTSGDVLRCQCNDGRVYSRPSVDDSTCELLIDVCGGELERETGAPDCSPAIGTAHADSCSATRSCLQEVLLADGAVASREDSEYVACTPGIDGRASCKCSVPDGFVFSTELYSLDDSECARAIELCRSPVTWNDQVTCRARSQQADSNTCQAEATCTRAGTSSGRNVYLGTEMGANCKEDGPGAFVCLCSGLTSTTIDVGADEPWEACSLAVDRCPDAIDLGI